MTETWASGLLPNWEAFDTDYIRSAIPHQIVVRADPRVILYVEEDASRIGVRFRSEAGIKGRPPAILQNVDFLDIALEGQRYIEVSTSSASLYKNFYLLISDIIESVVAEGRDLTESIETVLAKWQDLLSEPASLSEERQKGLFGELWLLDHMISALGQDAVEAWVGPRGEAHDFRVANNEFEVKTTSGRQRVHTINGLEQLEPSTNCALYLLSIQITDAGLGGETLSERIESISQRLMFSPNSLALFRESVLRAGFREQDAHLYPARRRLRDFPYLIAIGDGVPHLTSGAIRSLGGQYVPDRIGRVNYEIDVSGLGFREGSPEFAAILPSGRPASGAKK